MCTIQNEINVSIASLVIWKINREKKLRQTLNFSSNISNDNQHKIHG